jgi:hypothetical protein
MKSDPSPIPALSYNHLRCYNWAILHRVGKKDTEASK